MIEPKQEKQPRRPPAKNRRIVEERSGGVCESCGEKPASNIHHRKYLSRGGSHDVHNLIHLCGFGNTSGCHGRAHTQGTPEGLAIGRNYRSWLMPVLYRGEWVRLEDDGTMQHLSESTAEFLLSSGGRPDAMVQG